MYNVIRQQLWFDNQCLPPFFKKNKKTKNKKQTPVVHRLLSESLSTSNQISKCYRPVQRLRPRSLAGQRHPGPEVVQACGAQSCSAVATVTPQSYRWWSQVARRSLCQARLLQGQACWRVVVTGPWQQAHEVLAVPRQAASVCRT